MNESITLLSKAPFGAVVYKPDTRQVLYANALALQISRVSSRDPQVRKGVIFPDSTLEQMFHDVLNQPLLMRPGLDCPFEVTTESCVWNGKNASIIYIRPMDRRAAQMDLLINNAPLGIGICSMVNGFPLLHYFSNGMSALSGRTPREYSEMTAKDPMALVYPIDRDRLIRTLTRALENSLEVNVSYRVFHKDGHLVWIHLNGRPTHTGRELYLVFNAPSPEARLFQTIADRMADSIYVIDRENYDLLHVSDPSGNSRHCEGKKCYQVLHGLDAPCPDCHMTNPGSSPHSEFQRGSRFYSSEICETDWNGIPAFVKYVRDITDAVSARHEKESLEQYYHSILDHLPGGMTVLERTEDGRYIPEYFSRGLAQMLGGSLENLWENRNDVSAAIHPADYAPLARKVNFHIRRRDSSFNVTTRLIHFNGQPIWVSGYANVSYLENNRTRLFITFTDITRDVEQRDVQTRKYNEMLLEHYRSPGPDALIIGHGNLTKNAMIEVIDRVGGGLTPFRMGARNRFYAAISEWIANPDQREEFLQRFRSDTLQNAYRLGDTSHTYDVFMRFPDETQGRYVRVHVRVIAMPDTGDLMGILTIADITEKTVTRGIQRRLADASCETMMDVDLVTGRYCYHRFRGESFPNPTFHSDYEKSLRAFADQYVTARDREHFLAHTTPDAIRRLLRPDQPISFAYTLTQADGSIRVKRLTVFETDPNLQRVCITMTDITQSIQEQQNLLNVLAYNFEMMGVITLNTRSLTVHTRETMLNYQAPFTFSTLEEARDTFKDSFLQNPEMLMDEPFRLHTFLTRLAEQPGGYEFIYSSHIGGRPCHKQIYVLWGDENHNTVCIVRADVTGMLEAEQTSRVQLEDALKLARAANAAKSEFLSQMSHDIRTPMNAIIGMTDLALSDSGNAAQVDESLHIIRNASGHLLKLINNILEMSRIESGRMKLSAEPFSHQTEMNSIVARTQALALQHNLKFAHSISVHHDACSGDSTRIHQILDNLLGNSVKFTPAGGQVRLDVTELESKNDQTSLFRYVVSDTGVGMQQTELEHVFDPFYRTEQSRRAHIEGSGLGMSIVRNLIDFMGGSIKVESAPGKGTAVTVDLPIRLREPGACTERTEAGDAMYDLKGMHVLLVEDHPINQLVAKKLLERMNARVSVAEDGKQGWMKFAESGADEFDAICMDLRMPEMDGYESARHIRACDHPRARTIPIIAMTANAFAEDIQKCLDAGMNDHLSKPIDPPTLFAKLAPK